MTLGKLNEKKIQTKQIIIMLIIKETVKKQIDLNIQMAFYLFKVFFLLNIIIEIIIS